MAGGPRTHSVNQDGDTPHHHSFLVDDDDKQDYEPIQNEYQKEPSSTFRVGYFYELTKYLIPFQKAPYLRY